MHTVNPQPHTQTPFISKYLNTYCISMATVTSWNITQNKNKWHTGLFCLHLVQRHTFLSGGCVCVTYYACCIYRRYKRALWLLWSFAHASCWQNQGSIRQKCKRECVNGGWLKVDPSEDDQSKPVGWNEALLCKGQRRLFQHCLLGQTTFHCFLMRPCSHQVGVGASQRYSTHIINAGNVIFWLKCFNCHI